MSFACAALLFSEPTLVAYECLPPLMKRRYSFCTSLTEKGYNMPILNALKSDRYLVKMFPYYFAVKVTVCQ